MNLPARQNWGVSAMPWERRAAAPLVRGCGLREVTVGALGFRAAFERERKPSGQGAWPRCSCHSVAEATPEEGRDQLWSLHFTRFRDEGRSWLFRCSVRYVIMHRRRILQTQHNTHSTVKLHGTKFKLYLRPMILKALQVLLLPQGLSCQYPLSLRWEYRKTPANITS